MFDQYIKLFHLEWIAVWMVEAAAIIGIAIILVILVRKFADSLGE